MYPPSSFSKSTAPDGGDAVNNQYDSAAGATRDFSSLGSQTHHNPPPPHPPPPSRQQHNPNVGGHCFPGDPSSFDSDSNASSSLFRHRSSPAGFYDQYLPTDPNGNFLRYLHFLPYPPRLNSYPSYR
ncbi:unnamed protein product [Thlaspi arvense]|uniref:Uncharacterized protein n=1 Tax=Thlaspi arvense TaxID=13288 RepID=A0AAU9S9K1_THLAR|nr:unnamed protein product [Thlaspi arvense]